MKNIIVPFDFSAEALKGLQLALLFAEKKHTNIQLVYVKKRSGDYRPTSFEEEKRYAEEKMESIIGKYTDDLKFDSTLRYIIKKGKIFQEVVAQAESYKDSIICMSTHGASGFEEMFIGSNASKIITATDLPVITINKGECPNDIKKILLPIDTSPKSRQKVSYTAEFARVFDAEIFVAAVTSSKDNKTHAKLDSYVNQVGGYLESLKLQVKRDRMIGEDLSDSIIDYGTKIKADLISIMSEPSGFSLFSTNNSSEMIRKSPIAVLNITPKTIGKPGSFSTFGG